MAQFKAQQIINNIDMQNDNQELAPKTKLDEYIEQLMETGIVCNTKELHEIALKTPTWEDVKEFYHKHA